MKNLTNNVFPHRNEDLFRKYGGLLVGMVVGIGEVHGFGAGIGRQ